MKDTPKHPGAEFYEKYWATSDEAGAWGPVPRHRRRLRLQQLSGLEFTSLLEIYGALFMNVPNYGR